MKIKSMVLAFIIVLLYGNFLLFKNPKVSIILPVYNGEEFLPNTLSFLLNQTFSDFELIIIDDGSKDKSLDILADFANKDSRIKLYKNPSNLGIVKTRNKGIKLAKGEYIAMMDQDDISLPDRIKISVEYLDTHKNVDIVDVGTISLEQYNNGIKETRSGVIPYILSEGKTYDELYSEAEQNENIKLSLFFSCSIPVQSASMLRKSFLTENQIQYTDGIKYTDDYFLYRDLIKAKANFHHIKDIQHIYNDVRTHSSQFNKTQAEEAFRLKTELFADNGLDYQMYAHEMDTTKFMCRLFEELSKTNLQYKMFSQNLIIKNKEIICKNKN